MSTIDRAVRNSRKSVVMRVVEDEIILRLNGFPGLILNPADDIQREQNRMRSLIVKGVLEDVFGNIAVLGASENTDFPAGNRRTRTFRMGENNYVFQYDLSEFINAIKNAQFSSELEGVANATLRQMCIPFAENAKAFLRRVYQEHGEVSNLAKKMPQSCLRAPWVAFDFNGGLYFLTLTTQERAVVQNLKRRLFNTEWKKEVYNAQIDGAVGDQSV